MDGIYLDYNATTPIDPEVAEAMLPFLYQNFGNPSSNHNYGRQARLAIDNAREKVAGLINCEPSEIIFTGGGTESNNMAIIGTAGILKNKGNHIITSCIEHPAVNEVCRYLESQGFEITYLPVNEFGQILIKDLENAINSNTILITIMHANNEIGTIQPIEEIGHLAKKYHIRFHTDAAQSIAKVEVDVKKMNVELLSIAGHKFYAPKGVGALYIKKTIQVQKLMYGANHENNRRPGTENVLGIVGLGKAAEIANRDFNLNHKHQKKLTELFYNQLKARLPDIHLNGHPILRLPNTLSISFPAKKANILLQKMEGIAASAGAACHSEGINISQVLKSIQLPENLAMGTIRFSTGKFLTMKEIDIAAEIVVNTIKD